MAVIQQQVNDLENADLLDLQQREFLCPVCRRLGTSLLPALAPRPVSSSMLPSPAMEPSSVLPHQGTQQQAGPAGAPHWSKNHNNQKATLITRKATASRLVRNIHVQSEIQ